MNANKDNLTTQKNSNSKKKEFPAVKFRKNKIVYLQKQQSLSPYSWT